MFYLVFLLINLLFAILVFYLTIAFVTGAPFVPSTSPVSRKMIEFADIKPGNKIYDLGSGDGRLLFMSAKEGAHATGFEINPYLVFFTRLRILISGQKYNIKVIWKNFWAADINDADVVFIYLLPWRMERLAKLLQKNVKKGTIIVSNSFIFPEWKILKSDEKLHVYAFKVPLSIKNIPM